MHSTEDRLVRLERQCRSQRWIICGLALVFVLGMAPQIQDSLRVRSLVVVNDEGKICAMISGEKEGGTLSLFDVSKKKFGQGVSIQANKYGGKLELFSGTNKPQTELSSGGVLLRTETGFDAVEIGVDDDRGGAVVLANMKGNEQVRMTAMPTGAILRMFGSRDGKGWPFNAYVSDNAGYVFVSDAKGNTTGQLPAKK